MSCSPQRILANNTNLVLQATLEASGVLPVTNLALPQKRSTKGTARAKLSGDYTGTEEALYEIEITDTIVDPGMALVSAPTFSGVGSGRVTGISSTGDAQSYTIELTSAGIEGAHASVGIEGVVVEAVVEGTAGDGITINVNQSGLTFTASSYSLLSNLTAGSGGVGVPLIGQPGEFDWDTKAIDVVDGTIPLDAHRVSFGDDRSNVHLSYKRYTNSRWEYFLQPALTRELPKGTLIYFVTGGREVVISNGTPAEDMTISNVITAYDLLYGIKSYADPIVRVNDAYIVIDDRTPTGQAARELTARTDARAEMTSGSGSQYATGLEDVYVHPDAGTQLVTFTCTAVTAADHPFSSIGHERWDVKSSLHGSLGVATTGEIFADIDFAARVPAKYPPGFGVPKGRFSITNITYAGRAEAVDPPPICPVALALGPEAVDDTLTFTYTKRPSGNCDCSDMDVPNLSGTCLGTTGGTGGVSMYQPDTIARLEALHLWYKDLVIYLSNATAPPYGAHQAYLLTAPLDAYSPTSVTPDPPGVYPPAGPGVAPIVPPNPYFARATQSVRTVVGNFERTLAEVDALPPSSPPGLREAGCDAWDVACAEFTDDIDVWTGKGLSPPTVTYITNIPSDRYDASLNWVRASAGIATVGGDDASLLSGDGCWRDWGDTHWWVVKSRVRAGYLPLFTNRPGYSARSSPSSGTFSTHEWALQINVKCPEQLVEGDQIEATISDAKWGGAYVTGDILNLSIIAAGAIVLSGGRNAAPIQTWLPTGSLLGPMPNYMFDPTAPIPYSELGLTFLLEPGGVPWAKGDRFRWAIEGGHFKWRKDGGAWVTESPPQAIPPVSALLDEGLYLSFTTGATASFVIGDQYAFLAVQPWAVSNLLTPLQNLWRWEGDTATLALDFGSEQPIKLIAMLHALPETATINVSGGSTPSVLNWSTDLTWRPLCLWQQTDYSSRYALITITGAPEGAVQWPYLGSPPVIALGADSSMQRDYKMSRNSSLQSAVRFIGKATSGELYWSEGSLSGDEALALGDMLDYTKERDDEPIVVIPNIDRVDDPPMLVRIAADRIEFADTNAWGGRASVERRQSVTLPLEGVYQ